MNTAARVCTELHIEQAQGGPSASDTWLQLVHLLDTAPAAKEEDWPAFLQHFRARGSELRDLCLALCREFETAGANEDENEGEGEQVSAPLSDALRSFGVQSDRVVKVEHAQVLAGDADAICGAYLSEERKSPEVRRLRRKGDMALWQNSFARVALRRAMDRGLAPDSWTIRFAITLALEQAREAYGAMATAVEIQQEEAAA